MSAVAYRPVHLAVSESSCVAHDVAWRKGCIMKSVERAHIVVVASGGQSLHLAAQLCRVGVARASLVAGMEQARRLCLAGGSDLCLVAVDDWAIDAQPESDLVAPGYDYGVPSLLLAHVVTPYMRQMARRCGYRAAIPVAIAPRMLARRIGAALQRRSAPRMAPKRQPFAVQAGMSRQLAAELADFRKAKLH